MTSFLWIPFDKWETDWTNREHLFIPHIDKTIEKHVATYELITNVKEYFNIKIHLNALRTSTYISDGVNIHRISKITFIPGRFSLIRQINSLMFKKQLTHIIQKCGIDVVIGGSENNHLMPPFDKCPVIYDWFDYNLGEAIDMHRPSSRIMELERNTETYLRQSAHVVVVSSVLKDIAKKYNNNVTLIPNGVDIEKFDNANGENIRKQLRTDGPIVGYVGVHSYYSGLKMLIETIPLVKKEYKNVVYLIVGKGDETESLKRVAKNLGVEKNIIFTGWVPYNLIPAYCKAFDVGVLPSKKSRVRDAANPIKLIDYTAAGKPVVSTDLEEVKRMKFSNILISMYDVQEFADNIIVAINTKENINIPPKIKDYDIKVLAKKYSDLIRRTAD